MGDDSEHTESIMKTLTGIIFYYLMRKWKLLAFKIFNFQKKSDILTQSHP